jgi:RNA polymerase sigma factor (sigma-70 family)
MPQPQILLILAKLRTGQVREGWSEFLAYYSDQIYKTAYLNTSDKEAACDCYLYICEQLCGQGFKRLLRFRPEGKAKFETWLGVVVRNLCFDWLRKQFGRQRPFRSLQRLPQFENEVFQLHTQQGMRLDETFAHLKARYPEATLEQVEAADARVQEALSPRHRWLLQQRSYEREAARIGVAEEDGVVAVEPVDQHPTPELELLAREDQDRLREALGKLEPDERLLIRLRFEKDLSLAEVARLTGSENALHTHYRLTLVLNKLRKYLG